jgi:hypothetical protein
MEATRQDIDETTLSVTTPIIPTSTQDFIEGVHEPREATRQDADKMTPSVETLIDATLAQDSIFANTSPGKPQDNAGKSTPSVAANLEKQTKTKASGRHATRCWHTDEQHRQSSRRRH